MKSSEIPIPPIEQPTKRSSSIDHKYESSSFTHMETTIKTGRDKLANDSPNVEELKDLADVGTHWFKKNKARIPLEKQSEIELLIPQVNNAFLDIKGAKLNLGRDQVKPVQEFKAAVDKYFQCLQSIVNIENYKRVNVRNFNRMTDEFSTTQALIQKHIHDFEKLKYSVKEFDEQYTKINSFQIKNNKSFSMLKHDEQEEILVDMEHFYITSAKMRETLESFSSIDDRSVTEKKEERKKSIEAYLEKLPERCPTLMDLPKEQWWKLYIDAPYHTEAEKTKNPGQFFDDKEAIGYQQGMQDLLEKVLLPISQKSRQQPINYQEYTSIHQILTEYSPNKEYMRQKSGFTSSKDNFTGYHLKRKENPIDLHEQIAALKEVENEYINNRPLFQSLPETAGKKLCNIGDLAMEPITVGIIGHGHALSADTIRMGTFYSPEEGPNYVDTILRQYDESLKTAESKHDIIRHIAKTVRQLHILHQKSDGNGRTNMYGFMNACLIQASLCPAILPNGPDVFGGHKTLDGLVEDILIGMHSFIAEWQSCLEVRSF